MKPFLQRGAVLRIVMDENLSRQITSLKPGDHCLLIYTEPQEEASVLIPFIKAGLERKERCCVIVDESSLGVLEEGLRGAGVDVGGGRREGRLEFFNPGEVFFKGGRFDPWEVLERYAVMTTSALREGYSALRIVSGLNCVGGDRRNLEGLFEYEERIDPSTGSLNLCLYREGLFPWQFLTTVLNLHPFLIHDNALHKNTLFITPDETTSPLKDYIHKLLMYEDLQEENEEKRGLERLYRAITLYIPSALIIYDTDFRIVFVNDHFVDFTGLRVDDVVGRTASEVFPEEVFGGFNLAERLRKVYTTRRLCGPVDTPYRTPSGKEFIFKHTIYPVMNGERVEWLLSCLEDVTDIRDTERALLYKTDELNRLNRDLHELVMEMTTVEERERKRFAELLHEDIGQNLVAIKMAYTCCMKKCAPHDDETKEVMRRMIQLLDKTIQSTRNMTTDIYPVNLDDMSLDSAVRWYVKSIMEPYGIKVFLSMDRTVDELPDSSRRALFRIIRECFQNTLKYARANRIDVICRRQNRYLQLIVKDNGVGFHYEGIKIKAGRGFGLMLMREWTRSIQGRFNIHSHPGKGTSVHVEVPLSQKTLD